MSICSLTCQQSIFKRYRGDKHLSEFLPTDGGKKSTAWNMEQNGYGTKLHYCHAMYNKFVEILVFVSCVQGLVGLNVDR